MLFRSLHERAGALNVTRFHGSIWELQCWRNCGRVPQRWENHETPLTAVPPSCPGCGGLARPGVVWFGESIPVVALEKAQSATNCDLFITIGTSSLVYPAAGLVGHAKFGGAMTVEINLEATPSSGTVDLAIQGRAEELLLEIDSLI